MRNINYNKFKARRKINIALRAFSHNCDSFVSRESSGNDGPEVCIGRQKKFRQMYLI